MEAFVKFVQPLLPDWVVRIVLKLTLCRIVLKLRGLDYPQKEHRIVRKMKSARNQPKEEVKVTVATDKANEQHYEMPTKFFQLHLGPKLKYSSCEFDGKRFASTADIATMESITFQKYQSKLRLNELGPKSKVLEIGCGWGSLLLSNAEAFPHVNFYGFSNSATQIQYITSQITQRKLSNVTVWKQDVHDFVYSEQNTNAGSVEEYDRIVSIECIEHCRSYPPLFKKLATVMKADSLCFFQILGHREYTYFMNNDDWMGRNFFTGGTIPSMNLFLHFNDDLIVEEVEVVNGKEYANTLDIWLDRMYEKRSDIMSCFRENADSLRNESPSYMFEKWRMFYLMCSECFGYNEGKEWVVGYFTMTKRATN